MTTARLHVEVRGAGPRIVLVHGFTQTGRCWGPVADELARDHELVLVDAPGHGGSSAVAAGLVEGADLLAAAAGGTATWLGYSMGGRLALHVAIRHPAVVDGLVVVGATAGLRDPSDRAERRARDEALATRLEAIGLDEFLREWLAQPLFAGLPPEAACLEERRRNTVAGLASSLRLAGTGTQEPLDDELRSIGAPVLAVAGAHDERFVAEAARIAALAGPDASTASVAGAGHTAHLEQPERFLAVVRPWLAARGL